MRSHVFLSSKFNWNSFAKLTNNVYAAVKGWCIYREKESTLLVSSKYVLSYTEIAYDHIPTQVIFKPSRIELIKLDAKINPRKIAYIKGVKDVVPDGIRELGFDIEEYEVDQLAELDLNQFQMKLKYWAFDPRPDTPPRGCIALDRIWERLWRIWY